MTRLLKVGDRVKLTVDIRTPLTHHKAGTHGVIRNTAPWGDLHTLHMADGRTTFARTNELDPAPATTGPEFAAAHGNDSTNWTPADFDTVYCLAEMDLQPAWLLAHPRPAPATADIQTAA